MVNHQGSLYLLPSPLSEEDTAWFGPQTKKLATELNYFLVERAKTARHWLKKMNPAIDFNTITVVEFDKHNPIKELKEKLLPLMQGVDIGLMSEAGNPCIGDPGYQAVRLAHELNINIVPISGPCSFLQALISSGFQGQQFSFHGYLPNKKEELKGRLKSIEANLEKTGYTQIFMETPYRNEFMLEQLITFLKPSTMLSISCNLGSMDTSIKTFPISVWKKIPTDYLIKKPCVFIIGF